MKSAHKVVYKNQPKPLGSRPTVHPDKGNSWIHFSLLIQDNRTIHITPYYRKNTSATQRPNPEKVWNMYSLYVHQYLKCQAMAWYERMPTEALGNRFPQIDGGLFLSRQHGRTWDYVFPDFPNSLFAVSPYFWGWWHQYFHVLHLFLLMPCYPTLQSFSLH